MDNLPPQTEMKQIAALVGAADETPAEILRAYKLQRQRERNALRKIWEKMQSANGNAVQAGRLMIDLMDCVESGLDK